MDEKTKSLIRHILTALGMLLTVLGLDKFIPVVDYILANLDAVWAAILVIVGFVTAIIAFFKDPDRFKVREKVKSTTETPPKQ